MVKLRVNGQEQAYDGDPSMPLLWFLRDEIAYRLEPGTPLLPATIATRLGVSVTPVRAEYATNSNDAVRAAIRSTRADRVNTIPSCASARIQNTARFPKIAAVSAGELATSHAVTAVMANPPHIQP